MKIITRKSDDVSQYIFSDGYEIELTEKMLITDDFNAMDIKSTTHQIVMGVEPLLFVGGAMSYTDVDGWVVTNQEAYDNAFANEKIVYKARVKDRFQSKQLNPIVDTGLGYSVDGGYDKLVDFEIGRKRAYPQVRDSDNNFHNAIDSDYVAIINSIEQFGVDNLEWKWTKEAEIDACTTIEELRDVTI